MSDARRARTKTSNAEIAKLATMVERLLAISGQGLGASLTVPQFCALEGLSRSMYYKLRHQGRTPRTMSHSDGCVRISPQARADWHRQREAETIAAEK
jgi:predicted DNA-binding transcriptional regulator AlpA